MTSTGTTAAAQATSSIEIVWLDPAVLGTDPANPRANVGDVTDLAASIASLGILQPLIVTPDGDGHRVVTGHRRRAAAIAAGLRTVPCVVRAELTGADTLARQLVENIHRAGLTAGEQATAYAQLAAFDLSPAQIGKLVGRKTRHVKAALAAASLEEPTRSGASTAGLDLEQLAELAEFADDPDTVAALTQAAADGPGHFAHAVARKREARKRAAQAAQARHQLAADGYLLLDARPDWDDRSVRKLREFYDRDGQPLTPQAHADCPGRAAYIDRWADIEYYCMDPKARGHRTKPKTQPIDEAARAERRLVRDNNESWRASTAVRHEHITAACRSRKPPAGAVRHLAHLLTRGSQHLTRALDSPGRTAEHALAFLGHPSDGNPPAALATLIDRTADQRLPAVMLALAAAAHEQAMDAYTWRTHDPEAAAWLHLLADQLGYILADIEQLAAGQPGHADTAQVASAAPPATGEPPGA